MNEPHDDIEALLRDAFDGPVPDDGFCHCVVERLPRARRRQLWPLAAGMAVGAVTSSLYLLSSPLARAGWRDWLGGEHSMPAIVLMLTAIGISVLALGWMAAEAEDV